MKNNITRRDFLKFSGAGLVGLAIAGSSLPLFAPKRALASPNAWKFGVMADTQWRFLSDYPDVAECLERAPSMEARAMSMFIKNGMHTQFERAFRKHFGDIYVLLTKEQVLTERIFGDGTPNPRVRGFIGDYLAVATGGGGIDASGGARRELFKAAHAGMTRDEINVPFIVIECET